MQRHILGRRVDQKRKSMQIPTIALLRFAPVHFGAFPKFKHCERWTTPQDGYVSPMGTFGFGHCSQSIAVAALKAEAQLSARNGTTFTLTSFHRSDRVG
jgi:hypothetical protein